MFSKLKPLKWTFQISNLQSKKLLQLKKLEQFLRAPTRKAVNHKFSNKKKLLKETNIKLKLPQ